MEKEMLFREKQKVLLLRTILIKPCSGEIISVEEYPHQTVIELVLIAAIMGVIGAEKKPGNFSRNEFCTLAVEIVLKASGETELTATDRQGLSLADFRTKSTRVRRKERCH